MKCLKCGTEQVEGSKFCDTCGASLLEKNAAMENLQPKKLETNLEDANISSSETAILSTPKKESGKMKFVFSVVGISLLVDVFLIICLGIMVMMIGANEDDEMDISPYIESFIEENKNNYIEQYKPEMREYIDMRVEKYLDKHLEDMVEREMYYYY